ncbi:hypothetical protein PPS11_42054 [Pseudomonas putida S11]|nr:hypothetical protein PPS11_42054 [Pseudomonas putida S11]
MIALGARGCQVDVVGAGGGHQDQLQLRVGGQGRGVEHDLVADHRYRALKAFGDLLRTGGGEQFELVELLLQGREVEIAQVQGLVIEKHGATRAGA